MSAEKNDKSWFYRMRYGLFIHWGLYAIPAGNWQGQRISSGTEWIMKNARIPLKEYKLLADQFYPKEFDADEWVRMAKEDFGMRYIVFTTKHHDGFAMYDSKYSDYNIIQTPYGKDIVRQISEACKRQDMIFCIYYSQYQDWAEPDAFGNDWDFNPEKADFRKYLDEKVKPQLKELLTEYGPIGLVWFDTPYDMKKDYCMELKRYVKMLQPNCLINGRIGYGLGDYRQMSDKSIPAYNLSEEWETPMTLNDTWGYRREDNHWKSAKEVIQMLVTVAGRGGNLLLNIGPDKDGIIPPASVDILKQVGSWMKNNGESIYAADALPDFPYLLPWGGFTYRRDKNIIYMHILNYPPNAESIGVVGLVSQVKRAWLLKSGEEIAFRQTYEMARDEQRLRVFLPKEIPDESDTVIALEIEGEPVVQTLS